MSAQPLHVALLGNPNCGKTALFNLLTGARQKVANYAGVTVERKEGHLTTPGGRRVRVLDLPGAYSLHAQSLDEAVTRDVITGRRAGEPVPELLVCVTDATHLRLNLRLVLEASALGLPMVLVLNMSDMAQRQGIEIDRAVLARELGMPVVGTVGVRLDGARELLQWLDTAQPIAVAAPAVQPQARPALNALEDDRPQRVEQLHQEVRRIMGLAVREPQVRLQRDDRIDAVVLHPLWGTLLLAVTLFLMFQAVFSWAEVPMGWIEGATAAGAQWLNAHMAEGPLRGLLTEGLIAGVGGVVVFLPQILILFLFILALEESGYLPRAAFLLDRLMGTVGLSGRSFIPLLSSFACAVPGIMATRSIPDWRDRLVTIMIAPLMTCSARLPVYALLIAAFIPERTVAGVFNLQGVVLFALYLGGILSAMAVAAVAKLARRGGGAAPLLMELPAYRWAVGARADLPAPGGWHHPHGDGAAVVSVHLPRAAGGRRGPGHRIQLRGPHRRGAGGGLRAHRLQLADQHRAGARHGRARGGGERAGHGVRHRRVGRRDGRAARPAAGQPVAAGHGTVAAGVVHLRAAMRLHHRRRAARDQRLALAARHDGLPVRAGVPGQLHHLPRGRRPGRRLSGERSNGLCGKRSLPAP
jgi:ferrous iron transport protein B